MPSYAQPYKALGGDPSRPWGGPCSEPIYILEVGAGHGRLAFLILEFLRRSREYFPRCSTETGIPFVYVISDAVEANVRSLEQNEQLAPFARLGCLDFAVVDADAGTGMSGTSEGTRADGRSSGAYDEVSVLLRVSGCCNLWQHCQYTQCAASRQLHALWADIPPMRHCSQYFIAPFMHSFVLPAQVTLRRSGVILKPGSLSHPLVVVANYVADSLKQAAFRIDEGVVTSGDVTVRTQLPAKPEPEREDGESPISSPLAAAAKGKPSGSSGAQATEASAGRSTRAHGASGHDRGKPASSAIADPEGASQSLLMPRSLLQSRPRLQAGQQDDEMVRAACLPELANDAFKSADVRWSFSREVLSAQDTAPGQSLG